jgi:Fe-S cluster assembly protein SufD
MTMTESNRTKVSPEARTQIATGEASWLEQRRARAWEIHANAELPSRAVHRWRYTDPKLLLPGERPILQASRLTEGDVLSPHAAMSVEVHQRLGGEAVYRLGDEAKQAGVVIEDLSHAARHREQVEKWLGTLVEDGDSPFSALNAALWSGGLYLEVPAGASLSLPIRLLYDLNLDDGVAFPRSLISIGENAQVTLVDELSTALESARGLMLNRAVELIVGAGAQVKMASLQNSPKGATSYTAARTRVHRDAALSYVFGSFSGGTTKVDLTTDLAEPGANVDTLGFVFGRARQAFDHHAVQKHLAHDTTSHLDVRVALDDRAKSAATGLLWIGHEGYRSQAYQENRNLLLSEHANAISLPELEILTDDVKASHGATGGPVDPEQMYYLMTRGLSPSEAEALIVAGFFEPLLQKIPDAEVEERGRQLIEERLRS